MSRTKLIICILLGLSLTALYGCGEGKMPNWLQFGKARVEKKSLESEKIEGTVLASVNGRVIALEDFNRRIEAFNSEIQASKDIPDSVKANYLITTVEDKKRLLEGMVERELLIAEAIDRKLDKDKDLLKAVKELKEQLLFAKMIDSEKAKVGITSKEIENFYNQNKEAFKISEERKVSVIVVPSENRAKEILIQLLQGGDFATLARENSTDNSASSGGNIGFIVQKLPIPQPDKRTMFKKFEEVAFSLELNKPSAVFKGPDGYYLIEVTEVKAARQMLLSDVYNDIEQGLLLEKQKEVLDTLVGNLRKSSNIIVHEDLLKGE